VLCFSYAHTCVHIDTHIDTIVCTIYCLFACYTLACLALVTAVTSHPMDQPDTSVTRPRGAEQALKNIQEGRVSSPQPPVSSQPATRSSGKGWLKKLTERYSVCLIFYPN